MRLSWPHFSDTELACRCTHASCPKHGMDPTFMSRLEHLRDELGLALPVTSGYRCPSHNAAVSSTGSAGPHTTGRAVDIALSGEPVINLLSVGIGLGFSGFGLKQKGAHAKRFVHLDDLRRPDYPRPLIWTY